MSVHVVKLRKAVQRATHWRTGRQYERAVYAVTVPRKIAALLPEECSFRVELTEAGDLVYRRLE
jgi:hypothetical protein